MNASKWIIENQVAVGAIGFGLVTVAGLWLTKSKLRELGRALSRALNRFLGARTAAKIEEMLDEVVEGAKEDNAKDSTK